MMREQPVREAGDFADGRRTERASDRLGKIRKKLGVIGRGLRKFKNSLG